MSINSNNTSFNSQLIKLEAKRLGFIACGISEATYLDSEAPRLEKWLNNNMQGSMHYMENYFDIRLDPRKIVDGAKSVISLLFNYFPEKEQKDLRAPKISKYAYGRDYHKVVKNKMKLLLAFVRQEIGEVNGRGFVDSAPVMDKVWAQKSGIGWLGKNANIINRNFGSFVFCAELILDLPLQYDNPTKDYCGDCTLCIDACPTDAISYPYVVDGSKCISYFTIELDNTQNIPEGYKGKFNDWAFGCDICQDVCPWNKFSKQHVCTDFDPKEEFLNMTRKEWIEITEEIFEERFHATALKRAGFEGLKRNLKFLGYD